jgi:hypothetical protein
VTGRMTSSGSIPSTDIIYIYSPQLQGRLFPGTKAVDLEVFNELCNEMVKN